MARKFRLPKLHITALVTAASLTACEMEAVDLEQIELQGYEPGIDETGGESEVEDLELEVEEPEADPANAISFELWKVRRCNNSLCWGSSLTKSEFSYWDTYDVGNSQQKDTYIGTLREPAKANTKRLVLTLAGQNGTGNSIANGVGDSVVGSYHDWHDGWPNNRASEWHTISDGSVTHEFYDLFTGGDTFIATTWTHASNWDTSVNEKQDIEDAFYWWLRSKVYTSNLEEVVIAGFSRGGCMALRLGERFNRDLAHLGVDVAIMAVDPVCKVGDDEFGADAQKMPNPTNTNYEAVTTDMRSEFAKEGRQLYVQNYVSGHENFGLANIVGLSDDDASTVTYSEGGWYHQEWANKQHTAMDNYATWNNRPNEFYWAASDWFAEDCNNPCPHGGSYDSANCYVGTPPAGTTPFIWGGNFYYSPVGTNSCPLAGSWFDGANCYVGPAPAADDPFIYNGSWYYAPVWDAHTCDDYWTQWYDRDDSSGSGDYENHSLQTGVCANPIDVECQTTTGLPASSTGENIHCSPSGGLYCVNSQQPDGYCNYDYKVRFLCP